MKIFIEKFMIFLFFKGINKNNVYFFKILDDLEQIGGPVWVQLDTNWTPVVRFIYIYILFFKFL